MILESFQVKSFPFFSKYIKHEKRLLRIHEQSKHEMGRKYKNRLYKKTEMFLLYIFKKLPYLARKVNRI